MISPLDPFRSLLLIARRLCATSVRISSAGEATIVLPNGSEATPKIGGAPITLDINAITSSDLYYHGRLSRAGDSLIHLDGVEWRIKDKNGISLTPKKPFPSTLSMIAEFDPESLARFRSLYDRDDVIIRCDIAGETRAKDLAATIMAERAMIGLPSRSNVVYETWHTNSPENLPPLDPIGEGSIWGILVEGRYRSRRQLSETVEITYTHSKNANIRNIDGAEDAGIPIIRLDIEIVDSKPVGLISFSAAAKPLTNPELATAPELPWNVIETEIARRKAKAPKRQKTWLETTAKVGHAFIEQKLPRGYVSGRSLFFHGPIAYSESYNNPIAAFVADRNGDPTLVFGRSTRWAGSAVTSTAQSDIVTAAHAAGLIRGYIDPSPDDLVPSIRLGSLQATLSFADIPATDVPRHFMRSKDEDKYPRLAKLHELPLQEWYAQEEEILRKEIQEAHNSGANYPTLRRVRAFEALIHLHDHITRVNDIYAFSIPVIQDIDDIRQDFEHAQMGVAQREAALAARKQLTAPTA